MLPRLLFAISLALSGVIATTGIASAAFDPSRDELIGITAAVIGIVLGFLVLQEPVGPTLIVGTALVIAGVAIVNGRWGKRRLFAPAPPVEPA